MLGLSKGPMKPETRELYLKVHGGFDSILPLLHFMYQFKRRDLMLKWLINSSLNGKNLHEWFYDRHEGSFLSVCQTIAYYMDKKLEFRPINLKDLEA